jgi:hypothetical protein
MPLPRWGNTAKTPPEVLAHSHHSLERQIAATDKQIDRLVYDLYGLTADEIKIVEEADR